MHERDRSKLAGVIMTYLIIRGKSTASEIASFINTYNFKILGGGVNVGHVVKLIGSTELLKANINREHKNQKYYYYFKGGENV